VNDLPVVANPMQHDSAPVGYAWAITQMERGNCDISKTLDVQIARLQTHVGGLRPIST